MIPRAACRQRHGLLSSTSCLTKTSATSSPTQRLPNAFLVPLPGSSPPQRRHAHTVPSLGPQNAQILENGIEGLMSPDALNENWTLYMKHLLARLNDLLASGREAGDHNKNLKQLLIEYARNPAKANIFNFASMAHNHHFYMSTISQKPNVPMPEELQKNLERCFSSVHTLRETFLDVANAMFGPGYVWLVLQYNPSPYHGNTDADPPQRSSSNLAAGYTSIAPTQGRRGPTYDFRILPTYIAGSPYPGAHARQQARNLTNDNLETFRAQQEQNRRSQVQNSPGAFSTDASRQRDAAAALDGTVEGNKRWSGADVMPLMCVSTWQHAYMQDWGIDGKKQFLQAWWDRVDWEKVWANAGSAARNGPGR